MKPEEMALLAFYKALDHRLNDEKDGLYTRLNEKARYELLERCREDGTDRIGIVINGEKVGEIGVSYSKPKIAALQDAKSIRDAVKYVYELDPTLLTLAKGWEKLFAANADGTVFCTATGEVVPWAVAMPGGPVNAAVRGCKPEDVLRAFQGYLPDMQMGRILEGGK